MELREKILEVVGGPHVAAVATVDGKQPAVRFMVLNGFPDMTFVGGTMRDTKKVVQMKKNPRVAISTWSGREFSDPYVEMRATAERQNLFLSVFVRLLSFYNGDVPPAVFRQEPDPADSVVHFPPDMIALFFLCEKAVPKPQIKVYKHLHGIFLITIRHGILIKGNPPTHTGDPHAVEILQKDLQPRDPACCSPRRDPRPH